MVVKLHKGDLCADVLQLDHDSVAVDVESTGLNIHRDRVCTVQLSFGNGHAHVVQLSTNYSPQDAINLSNLLQNENITKIFHFARYDCAILGRFFNCNINNIYCTKIASKIARTYTDRHGLRSVISELIGINIDKSNQCSDWGNESLSRSQLDYAANDVLYLHKVREKLDILIAREQREEIFSKAIEMLKHVIYFDIQHWDYMSIFEHR